MPPMPRAAVLLALALVASAQMLTVAPLTLEVRIFNGRDEVTRYTRVTIHKAGERGQPVAQMSGAHGAVQVSLPEGIYDVQAIEEREGQVVNIQWANRLVVMPYPDEQGRHLEVLNFKAGFGALQIRAASGPVPEVALHANSAAPAKAAASKGGDYVLFVVESGTYDVEVRRAGQRSPRHTGVEVPRDRTRLWIVPSDQGQPSRLP
jgi:hypothetical protein